jgi:hypothetical protein
MNLRPIAATLLLGLAFTGCATFNDQEIGQIRQHGVSPIVVGKMQKGDILTPQDVIQLSRRGVPDEFIIRQIQDAGVDYVLGKDDLKKLAAAHVSKDVAVALIMASDEFARDHSPNYHPRVSVGYGVYDPYDFSAPYPPYAYPDYAYPYYGGAVYYGGGGYWHHHWH